VNSQGIQIDCDVLIIGAGPTGLTLALALARDGVSVIIAERELTSYPLPRAAHIDHQTVRIFQDLGLATRILNSCRQPSRYDFLSAGGEVLLRFEGLDRIASGGWPAANAIHQPAIELVLRDEAQRQTGIDLRNSWRFAGLSDHHDHVECAFETSEGPRMLRARYVVGADGARSPVREAIGVGMEDLGFDESWLIVDTIVHDRSRVPDVNLQICDPARPTTCVVMGAGRHRWEFMVKQGETPETLLTDAAIAALLEPWNVAGAVEIERKVVYRFGAKVAQRWQKGRVFIAGDAAHLTPPFAGQGLCSGVRDAANLAWKIGAVLQRGEPGTLLDTYQLEREPHARATIQLAIMMGSMVCVTDQQAASLRDQQLLAARAAGSSHDAGSSMFPDIADGFILTGTSGAGSYFPQPIVDDCRLDDVLGPGAWLITRQPTAGQAAPGLRVVSLADPAIASFSSVLACWLDAHHAPAVLVRPDRYVFGVGVPVQLMASYRAQLGGAVS
jgi:3-(3-hydroxy-phenyl)propionate hydroxylase